MSKPEANFGEGKQFDELTSNSKNIHWFFILCPREKETLLCLVLYILIESQREFLFPTVNCFPIKAHFT